MPWARLDDQSNDDSKLNALGSDAFRIWVRGNVYCQKNLTDGFIPEAQVPALAFFVEGKARRDALGELLAVLVPGKGPLWHKTDGGYRVHDYLHHNDPRDKVLAGREKGRKRLERFRNKGRFNAVAGAAHNALHEALRNAFQAGEQISVANAVTTYHVPPEVPEPSGVPEPEQQERADARSREQDKARLAEQIRQHRRRRSRETDDGRPAKRVIAALARTVLEQHPDESDDGELRELLKRACARANLQYDSATVGAAVDTAKAQLRRSS